MLSSHYIIKLDIKLDINSDINSDTKLDIKQIINTKSLNYGSALRNKKSLLLAGEHSREWINSCGGSGLVQGMV